MNGVPEALVRTTGAYGLIYGGSWEQMGLQATEVASIGAWTLATATPFFLLLRATGRLRVTRETEVGGLDLFKHGSLAYTGGERKGVSFAIADQGDAEGARGSGAMHNAGSNGKA